MSDRNQRQTVSDTSLLNYFVKTIGIQIGVVFVVIALLVIVFLTFQSIFPRQDQQDQSAPPISEDNASNSENTTSADVNVTDTLNAVCSQYSSKDIYLRDAHPDIWYDDYTLWSNGKKRAIALYGGTEETERAVGLALRWLKSRQSTDGSWTNNSDNAKPSLNVNGATGLAALPFLAAGCLDSTSEYKDAVESSLNYLIQHGKTGEDFNGVRYCEPDEPFYNHALAALALGEAAVRTGKSEYFKAAKGAMEYLAHCQNPNSGVWDSVLSDDNLINTSWSVEALRGAYRTSYDSAFDAARKVRLFLDSVQNASNDARSTSDSITSKAAQEILLRIYLYPFDSIPNLESSVERLCKIGPTNDSYYNYIATQILFHYGGAPWKEWNAAMREKLINAQIQTGTEAGSWNFTNEQSSPKAVFSSSPFIDTALSALTLETYYRYKPRHLKWEYEKGFPTE
ncbi:MAG: hypothetical protein IKX40_07885 [Thermoguttaceae bacterium]|nr:hypothetical protein [Thermoguttaceae bacterium]